MKKIILSLVISGISVIVCMLFSALAITLNSEGFYKGFISAAGASMVYFFINLLILIGYLVIGTAEVTGNIHGNIKIKQLLNKINKERCNNIDEEKIIKLFTISPKELMMGEKIMNSQGILVKKKSDIKNAINRCAAELSLDMTFSINEVSGEVYKVLKFNFDESKSYYNIGYDELNRCLEMNEKNRVKFKKITEENWKSIIGKAE